MESHLAVLADEGSHRGHRTLAEKAFQTLHRAIITGGLRPGSRLPIEELADVLGMSPMPVREAVRRLDAAGLVENIPHRGARVTELSITDNSAETSAAHEAFPFALYDAADSAWLLRLIRPVWETSERYCLDVPQCRQLAARGDEHRAILDACIARNPDAAAVALHEHRRADRQQHLGRDGRRGVVRGQRLAACRARTSSPEVGLPQILALEQL
jgi:DNA-binding GntR family transcriptional regulator